MMERFRTWNEILMERLSDPEDVIGYLEVSLEEYLDDGDKAFFLKGIKNVIEAQGGILSVSEQASIDPSFLSDAVNNGSMPPFHILSSIFTSFGGMSFIDLPTELMSNVVARRALGTSREMVSEQVIAENFTERTPREMVSARQLQNIKYWTKLCKHLDRRNSCLQRPTTNASHYRDLQIGIKGFSLRARQTIKHKEISASLVMRGANAIGHFYSLRVQEEEIERILVTNWNGGQEQNLRNAWVSEIKMQILPMRKIGIINTNGWLICLKNYIRYFIRDLRD